MTAIRLPQIDGTLAPYTPRAAVTWPAPTAVPRWNRVAFAAAHVVADPRAAIDPWLQTAVDWDATLAFRRHLWSHGFGVAEAMDTAQRGMGLDWPTSLELIERSVSEAQGIPGAVVFSGAGTDHLPPRTTVSLDEIVAAYEAQCEAIEAAGGRIILMASRALAAYARSPDDYAWVYGRVLSQVRAPVILHWLGEMFDPALAGYWVGAGGLASDPDHARATDVCAAVIGANAVKVDGVKVSLLDQAKEVALRSRLPEGVRMYTGDDFNFAALIGGDATGHSDALLGIFDAIAPAASAALTALGSRRPRTVRCHSGPDGAVIAACLRGTDTLLQDRRRVPRVAQRSPVAFHDGGRAAERAQSRPSVGFVPARGRRRTAARSRSRRHADARAPQPQRRRGVSSRRNPR